MKRHAYLPALLLTAALLVGCGHKAQPDADTDPNAQAALPPEGITALVMSDDTQVLRFRRKQHCRRSQPEDPRTCKQPEAAQAAWTCFSC